MAVQRFLQSKRITELGLEIGRHMPPLVGRALSWLFSRWIVLRKTSLYQTVYANLRIVVPDADHRALRRMARQVFYHAGQTYYDFFHALDQPPAQLAQAVRFEPGFLENLERYAQEKLGVIVLAMHTSNFDLAALALAARGFRCQALSVPTPSEGFQIANELRIRSGHDITPLSPGSLRQAIRRLQAGGIVVMGVDYPQPGQQERPIVLGYPSYLPVGSARLALMSGAVSILVSCQYDRESGYFLHASEPIEMVEQDTRQQAIMANTARLATLVEKNIQRCPAQWLMFHPFWPAAEKAIEPGRCE